MTFLQGSYDKNDEWGKSKVKQYLLDNGYFIESKISEDYGLDIKAEKNGKIEYFEAEVKTGYPFTCQEDFRYDTVSFLARKSKWSNLGFWYFIVCRETSAFVKCHSSVIFQDKFYKTIPLKNKWSRGGSDNFYHVPKDLCEWGTI